MVIVLMGAAGAGKTTVGRALATAIGWRFVDGDDFHTREHLAKMQRGEPLSDQDRAGWLQTLHGVIMRALERREHTILACSSLKGRYRQVLAGDLTPVRFVHLVASPQVLRERLAHRENHFAGAALLASQLTTLEAPVDALTLDTTKDLAITIGRIRHEIGV